MLIGKTTLYKDKEENECQGKKRELLFKPSKRKEKVPWHQDQDSVYEDRQNKKDRIRIATKRMVVVMVSRCSSRVS